MTWRRLPEQGLARQQRDAATARQLRFLQRRVRYPGHHRMVREDQVITNTPGLATFLSMEVDAGAWMVTGKATLSWESGTNAQTNAIMTVAAFDAESGLILEPAARARWAQNATPVAGPPTVRIPLIDVNHFEHFGRARLELNIQTSTVGAAKVLHLFDLMIHASPV